jgi:hypothetical protein
MIGSLVGCGSLTSVVFFPCPALDDPTHGTPREVLPGVPPAARRDRQGWDATGQGG